MIKLFLKTFYLILMANILLLAVIGVLVWQTGEEKIKLTQHLAKIPLTSSAPEELLSISLGKLQPQLMVLENYFLSASTTVGFLERLEKTAKLSKVDYKINQAEAKDNLRLNFSAQGSFVAVNQFLTLLEKFPYALRIERLDLRVGDKGVWRGDFVITVITQK